jgi:hypothetical protein
MRVRIEGRSAANVLNGCLHDEYWLDGCLEASFENVCYALN